MNILFINSQNFWLNGWLNTSSSLNYAINTLTSMDLKVSVREVKNSKELEDVLKKLPSNTLVWANAYYTQTLSGEIVWIQEVIEKYNLPYIGTGVKGLKTMLDKPNTHKALDAFGVPIPQHLVISRSDIKDFEDLFKKSKLNYPIVIKPTAESCSMGVIRANNLVETQEHIIRLFDEFPHSEALLETFLPNEDITCGYLQLDKNIMLLPTYYKSLKRSGKEYVVERDMGVTPWSGDNIVMPPVEDEQLLNQLSEQMPKLVQAMNITGITRADARMDRDGILRFFDVNGMPALSFPKSVLVRQVRECFSELPENKVYELLLNTIVAISAHRFNLRLPNSIMEQNLFSHDKGQAIHLSV